ncbi:DNA-formamidopyrimidine glycosylase family protein [Saccharomonospora xinjiangensis]|uniref:DNA-formamidopyrimidine glycosylase family protein n=1 Tax=Saccharomonospora xinjiangensis TaxID=75294 RepID=UPI00106FDCCA|nr:DNA-formamidopyrimidine glycosylase family protein [Saccharomonospora xinjiangensis]QBQ61148.1 Endonuclease 8 [Saccharomonospora xinjiangensis]
MPEGDTVLHTGERLRAALVGRTLTRTDFRHPALATLDLTGLDVVAVRTVGKHLFLRFSDGTSLHSHLKMDGSWRVFTPGQRWSSPGHHARVILGNRSAEVVGFRVHDLAVVPTEQESRFVGHLGPDLLDPEWGPGHAATAVERLRQQPDAEIGEALLDQRVMAGIGNVYKTEICFLLGVSPWTPVAEVDAERTVELARRLLSANAHRSRRTTTGMDVRGRRSWVYERTRHGCLRCGGKVRVADQGVGTRARPTWFCPRCQPGPAPA